MTRERRKSLPAPDALLSRRGLYSQDAMAFSDAVDEPQVFHTITQLAEDLGVTARAVRFYEQKGLISPSRVGTTRVYTRREHARMQLILRGKRLGFTLREIREFLDLYDVDITQQEQMRSLVRSVRHRIDELDKQKVALDKTLEELLEIERQATDLLEGRIRPKRLAS